MGEMVLEKIQAEKEKLQVNVDFTNYPELYEALEDRVSELDTDRSKFIRQLVRKELLGTQSPTKKSKQIREPQAA